MGGEGKPRRVRHDPATDILLRCRRSPKCVRSVFGQVQRSVGSGRWAASAIVCPSSWSSM